MLLYPFLNFLNNFVFTLMTFVISLKEYIIKNKRMITTKSAINFVTKAD